MRNQLDVVEKAVEVKNTKRRKSDNQQSVINSILTSVAATPTSDNKSQRSQLSLKQYSDLIPRTYRYRLFKQRVRKGKCDYLTFVIKMVLY